MTSKIAILLPDFAGGGVERVKLILARELVRQGHEVTFVVMQARGELVAEARADFAVHDLACPRTRFLPRALSRHLRQHRPDALLASMWPLTVIAPMMHMLGYRGRIVVAEHCNLSIQYSSWGLLHRVFLRSSMALAYRLADARVGVSAGVVDDLRSLSGLSGRAFEVIYNPILPYSPPASAALNTAKSYWPGLGGPKIITVGSFKSQKNHALLLRAFALLPRELDARLMLLGDGVLRSELEVQARELGISDRLAMPGFFSDTAPFYSSSDLFVLSSDYEGFGNVIVEALACGLPVVSTDCPSGPAEILANGEYGTLVPVGNEVALAAAIQRALVTPVDVDRLRGRALDFAPEIAASRYLELLT